MRVVHGHNQSVGLSKAKRWLAACLVSGLLLTPAVAADQPSKLALTKAAFVFNFSKYTEWPAKAFASASSPIFLCIFDGDTDVGKALLKIDGRSAQEREVRVRLLERGQTLSECHIVFIEQDDGRGGAERLAMLQGAPVLTVGDGSGFAARGGMIELVPRELRLGFEVNLKAAERAHLRLSSQLLALARIVKEG